MTQYGEFDCLVLNHVITAIKSLIDLLTRFGEQGKATWLEDRLAVLIDADAADETKLAIMHQLHEIVLGMGGLADLYLKGQNDMETLAANDELERLADQLFELTR
jgi:hypothetical protein